jgi:hypothetical protein
MLGRAFKAGAKTGPEIQEFLSKKIGEVEGVTGKWRFDERGQVVMQTSFVQVEKGTRKPLN